MKKQQEEYAGFGRHEGSSERKENILETIKMSIRLCTPWLRNFNYKDTNDDYTKGWNDCVKEMRKNRKKYLEKINNL